MPRNNPSVGRIVHFVLPSGVHCAAIITHVMSPTTVNLLTFEDLSGVVELGEDVVDINKQRNVLSDFEEKEVGTWHWPEIV